MSDAERRHKLILTTGKVMEDNGKRWQAGVVVDAHGRFESEDVALTSCRKKQIDYDPPFLLLPKHFDF